MKPKAKTLIEKHGFIDPDRKSTKHDEIQFWVYNNIQAVLKAFTSEPKTFDVSHKQLEYPIMQNLNNYSSVVGFVDLFVCGRVYPKSTVNDPALEVKSFVASIEVKSSIHSCGDLIRQINFYRRYERERSTWIVVSPDDRFTSILLEQGIYFYKYQDPSLLF